MRFFFHLNFEEYIHYHTHLFSSFRNMFLSSSFLGLSEELILVSSHFSLSSIFVCPAFHNILYKN